MRGDDAAGLEVARLVRTSHPDLSVWEHEREPSGLIEAWAGLELAIVCDAVAPASAPGRIDRFEADREPLPARLANPSSTHALGLGEVIELGRSLGRLPSRLVVYGIEAGALEPGAQLTSEVARAVETVAGRAAAELAGIRPADR